MDWEVVGLINLVKAVDVDGRRAISTGVSRSIGLGKLFEMANGLARKEKKYIFLPAGELNYFCVFCKEGLGEKKFNRICLVSQF